MLQIDLDRETSDALTSLAEARGTTPADLVARIVGEYVARPGLRYATMDEVRERIRNERPYVGPDPLDAMVGSLDIEPVDDIDEVIYGR